MTAPSKELTAADLPIDRSGPLPLTTTDLALIRPEKRDRYVQGEDGVIRLKWLGEHDEAERTAYVEQIAGGALSVYAEGDSPALAKAREDEAVANREKVAAEMQRMEDAERKAELERRDRRDAAERAKTEARIKLRNGTHSASELAELERLVRQS